MNNQNDSHPKTAILLFAQTEQREALSKNISSHAKNNILLWKKLNQKAVQIIKNTHLPYFISDETTQVGDHFGSKITAAVQSVFDKGFEKVIVIGNDSLSLSTTLLLEAARNLEYQDIILGADWSGGVYLMGISKQGFDSQKFESIAWQTDTVFNNLKNIFAGQSIFLLPRLKDFHDYHSFQESLLGLNHSSRLKAFLIALILEQFAFFTYKSISYFTTYFKQFYNKGSPVLA
ncbi:DUF2064 domain-containing protein [Flavobacterium algicola]|uniref:DUF2064 domain-containing protein n=1 Tax=Flavobacterium algicola TaxID=556529 RepID=UPI001EFC6174|nr:DUF2064 domain-containing protein [Flavobacterium algicola]MCG9792526.1 DUF2064 domain-containing protein [Flavobacterium algicola]